MPQSLTSADLAARLASAEEAELSQRRRLQALQAAGVAAGVSDSPEETAATRDLEKIAKEAERLRVALEHARHAERTQAVVMQRADEDAEDRAAEAALDGFDKAASALQRALETYVATFEKFGAARDLAQQRLNNHRGNVFRRDLLFMKPAVAVSEALFDLSPTIPGAKRSALAGFGGAPLSAGDGLPFRDKIDSLVSAARADLETFKRARDPLDDAPPIVAAEPAESWVV